MSGASRKLAEHSWTNLCLLSTEITVNAVQTVTYPCMVFFKQDIGDYRGMFRTGYFGTCKTCLAHT